MINAVYKDVHFQYEFQTRHSPSATATAVLILSQVVGFMTGWVR